MDTAFVVFTAELSDELVFNGPSRCRSGRVLGRAHAAKGEHKLSTAAFDAALLLAKQGRYLMQEYATVRARAAAGVLGGGGAHWPEQVGRQRLREAAGRMALSEADRAAALRTAGPGS